MSNLVRVPFFIKFPWSSFPLMIIPTDKVFTMMFQNCDIPAASLAQSSLGSWPPTLRKDPPHPCFTCPSLSNLNSYIVSWSIGHHCQYRFFLVTVLVPSLAKGSLLQAGSCNFPTLPCCVRTVPGWVFAFPALAPEILLFRYSSY